MNEILADGYKKVRGDLASEPSSRLLQYPIFQIPTIERWIVVVSGKHTEELHRAPDEVLSFVEAAREVGSLASQLSAHSPNHRFSRAKATTPSECPLQRIHGTSIPFADR